MRESEANVRETVGSEGDRQSDEDPRDPVLVGQIQTTRVESTTTTTTSEC